MPAYAKDGEVVCHFQSAAEFACRYATPGFGDEASLDDGAMWPVAYALTELTPEVEDRIVALLRKAIGWRSGAHVPGRRRIPGRKGRIGTVENALTWGFRSRARRRNR